VQTKVIEQRLPENIARIDAASIAISEADETIMTLRRMWGYGNFHRNDELEAERKSLSASGEIEL
jgi:hypothetical protein